VKASTAVRITPTNPIKATITATQLFVCEFIFVPLVSNSEFLNLRSHQSCRSREECQILQLCRIDLGISNEYDMRGLANTTDHLPPHLIASVRVAISRGKGNAYMLTLV
jgi:hypothetical protein